MFFFKLPNIFRKKPVVRQQELDEFSEDGCRLDDSILIVMGICKKYDEKGMHAMAKEIHRQVGEHILQRGLRRWQV